MTPNTHYAGAEARPDVTLRRIAYRQSLALAFASGKVDMAFNRPVETLSMPETMDGKTVSFPVACQYLMWMNTRSPALSDPRVLRAIDLAVSREDLVTAAQAGVPGTGALADSYPCAAEGSLSHGPDAAVGAIAAPSGREVLRPRLHQRAPLLEEIVARAGGLGLVLDHVRERRLHDRMRRV